MKTCKSPLTFVLLALFALCLNPELCGSEQAPDSSPATVKTGVPASGRQPSNCSNPVWSLSVRRVAHGWQARLQLNAVSDSLQVRLNGQAADYLFKPDIVGIQTAWLAPDDGLRYGLNTLEVTAVYRNQSYPAVTARFNVPGMVPLASAGRDRNGYLFETELLDAGNTLSQAEITQVEWQIVRAPAGSIATLMEPQALQASLTPDVNGTYEFVLTVHCSNGTVATDRIILWVTPNFPPVGVGIETMKQLPGGGYGIVIGTNCTSDLYGCPEQTQTFPYDTQYPVQLLVLDRNTLEQLNDPQTQTQFKGNYGDAYNIGKIITGLSKNVSPKPIVIVAALPGNLPLQPDQATAFQELVLNQLITEASVSPWRNIPGGSGGWSAVGVVLEPGAPGPAGHLNVGYETAEEANLKGYLQHYVGVIGGEGQLYYNFVTADYASFNTSIHSEKGTNEMMIGGVSYTANLPDASCGGFQLVRLSAASLTPVPGLSENQVFATNCGTDTDSGQIDALADAVKAAINTGEPVLVFLQSMGTPISSSNFPSRPTRCRCPLKISGVLPTRSTNPYRAPLPAMLWPGVRPCYRMPRRVAKWESTHWKPPARPPNPRLKPRRMLRSL